MALPGFASERPYGLLEAAKIWYKGENKGEVEKSMARNLPAFSLIEIAIVLIIIGLVSGMALPMLKSMIDWQKTTTTTQNQEKILYALASYAVQNKILPYAGDPETQQGKQDRGRRRGIVPYADLGLPESAAKDGYHRWFTYVIDDHYATFPRISSGPVAQQPMSRLCERGHHANPLTIKGFPEAIALALISHGPQGRGAYPNHLGNPPQGEDEIQNAASDTEIVDRPFSQDPLNPFSHKVVWVTPKNLMAIYARAPCAPIESFIPQSGGMRYNPVDERVRPQGSAGSWGADGRR
jgi:type II secretory pathway pseudopilin PulG